MINFVMGEYLFLQTVPLRPLCKQQQRLYDTSHFKGYI